MGDRRYVLQAKGMKVGDKIMSAESGLDIVTGNCMRLKAIPVGTLVL